jgi:hypothetical protein
MVMPIAAAVVLVAGVAAPHAVRLDEAPPPLAAGLWLCALLLRAVGSLLAAVSLELFVPSPARMRRCRACARSA